MTIEPATTPAQPTSPRSRDTGTIDVTTLRAWLADGDELAVLDVRPTREVGYASPLFATNLPAEHVLDQLDRYVPRKRVRTVLVDGGDGVAARLAATLRDEGWDSSVALTGGLPAWEAQDGALPTFDVPGKDFSLGVQAERDTPAVTADELRTLRGQGADVVVLDTRTLPEFAAGHVPGAVSVPGAELLRRFADVVPDPRTHVVVSCAGLPRAILGAQTLIDADVPNAVSFLYDGTQAWIGTGGELEVGPGGAHRESASVAATKSIPEAARHVEALSRDHGVPEIDLATARAWAADPDRTTYLLDVRTPAEYEAAHLPGSLSAEGGQLLGVAYRTIAVRGARVVLVDDTAGARAAVVVHWLRRRGFELAVLRHDFDAAHTS